MGRCRRACRLERLYRPTRVAVEGPLRAPTSDLEAGMKITNGTRLARPLAWAIVALALLTGAAMAQSTTDQLRQAAEAAEDDPRPWVELGNALLDDDRPEAAKTAFLEAVAVDYRSCDAHYGLGLAEFQRGDHAAALFSFNEVTRLCEERFDGHYNRAVTLARLRRPAEAAEAFRDAIAEAEPEASADDRVNAWVGVAGQRKRTGDYDAAAEAYGSALQIRPTDDELIFLRAHAVVAAATLELGQVGERPDRGHLRRRGPDRLLAPLAAAGAPPRRG